MIHFHDLRHTGNTFSADAGANLRELMERMGHSSTRAALVYLHSTSERQRAIAAAVDKAARVAMHSVKDPKADPKASGTTYCLGVRIPRTYDRSYRSSAGNSSVRE